GRLLLHRRGGDRRRFSPRRGGQRATGVAPGPGKGVAVMGAVRRRFFEDEPKRPSPESAELAGARAVPVELPSEVNPRLPSLFQPASFAAEQYRGLRHVVEQIRKSAGISVFAVSSPTVHDG